MIKVFAKILYCTVYDVVKSNGTIQTFPVATKVSCDMLMKDLNTFFVIFVLSLCVAKINKSWLSYGEQWSEEWGGRGFETIKF